MKNIVNVKPQNAAFYNYLLKVTNKNTNEIIYKVGKADIVGKRVEDWIKDFSKYGYIVEILWYERCWFYDKDGDGSTYYMTKNDGLFGNDSDDIFREILKNLFGVEKKKLIINGETITDEWVDFHTTNDKEVKNMCNRAFDWWVDEVKHYRNCDKHHHFTKVCKIESKDKKEFYFACYDYQKKFVNRILYGYDNPNGHYPGVLEVSDRGYEFIVVADCGTGKSIMSIASALEISKIHHNRPMLLIAGIKSVFESFKNDCKKWKFNDTEVVPIDIERATKKLIDDEISKGHFVIVYTTCQSSIERGCDGDGEYDKKMTKRVKRCLDDGVRFCCVVTDEAHKIVFGNKMKNFFPLIREYHKEYPLHSINLTGTGFSLINKKPDIDFHYTDMVLKNDYVFENHKKRNIDVKRHIIISRNKKFLSWFYKNLESGWDYLLCDGLISRDFEDVDNINCISTIKKGLEKPVICAYMDCIESVKKSFSIISDKFSCDDVLVISANGCVDGRDTFIKNSNNECGYVEVTPDTILQDIHDFSKLGKMVILLNVEKFVESWTIPEMNIILVLKNSTSPDAFFQSISRGMRTYVEENGYAIKRDTFVFLYGGTFVNMSYELYRGARAKSRLLAKHGYKKDIDRSMRDLFGKNTIFYIDSQIYDSSELKDRDEIRKIIIRESETFHENPDSFLKYSLYEYNMEVIPFENFYSGRLVKMKNKILKIGTTNNNKENEHYKKRNGENGCDDSTNKMNTDEMLNILKTFIMNLYIQRCVFHSSEDYVTFDTLISELMDEVEFDIYDKIDFNEKKGNKNVFPDKESFEEFIDNMMYGINKWFIESKNNYNNNKNLF